MLQNVHRGQVPEYWLRPVYSVSGVYYSWYAGWGRAVLAWTGAVLGIAAGMEVQAVLGGGSGTQQYWGVVETDRGELLLFVWLLNCIGFWSIYVLIINSDWLFVCYKCITQAFVDKLLEFLDLHVSARRGRVRPPVIVPDCVPAALRELGLPNPMIRVGRR